MSDEEAKLPDLRYVRELAKVFRTYGLDEIEIENSEQRILLRRGGDGTVAVRPLAAAPVAAVEPAPAAAPAQPGKAAAAAAKADAGEFITSPFVGTFYSAPRPDADQFVNVGESVSAGQTVCIIEAMKLFNEIEAEFGCVIEEVLVENGEPVEFGAKLFRVRRL